MKKTTKDHAPRQTPKVLDRAARVFAKQHGLSTYDAERVLTAMDLPDDDLVYVSKNVGNTMPVDYGSSDQFAGHNGWIVWFDISDTAIFIGNANPEHGENLSSMAEAISWAEGAEE
jgi:hypothetical protein